MADCVFCKIAAGEIPADKVYEDGGVVAFRDISPQAPTHIIIIPRAHIESAADISEDSAHLAAECFAAIARIAKSERLEGGFRVITNAGADAGQTVGHLHFHLLGGVKMGEGLI
ncbi:MAG: histidine triad nucleotide-binding protein [Oscillospiraceae bacterium]|jgi:histidine triad (HIT) family protein|nr:histidine triad nucleotide-binding protein [Oscillospiraceae bacterium]